jgi:putative toxin-antitoxin system antitoxin component (TIGR02293 family)
MTKVEEAAAAYRSLNPLQRISGRSTTAKVVPIYQWTSYKKIETIKEGITKEELENLKEQTGLDYNVLAKILAVTKATLHNKKGKERFDAFVSERILLLADIYSFGYTVFEDKENFNRWMKTPNRALGNEMPLNLAETIYGMEEIKNVIGRINYGVYS